MIFPKSQNFNYALASDSDRDWLIKVWTSSTTMRLIPGGPMPFEKAVFTAEKTISKKYSDGLGYWIIRKNGSSEQVGYVVLRDFNWDARFHGVELGYIIDEAFWGKGIASEVASTMAAYAIKNCGAESLLALVNNSNTASIRVVQKIGFQRVEAIPEKYPENSIWKMASIGLSKS